MPTDVFSPREIAAAAGVTESEVRARMARGQIRSVLAFLPASVPLDPRLDELVPHAEALRAVGALAGRAEPLIDGHERTPRLITNQPDGPRGPAMRLLAAASVHALVAAVVLVIGSLGLVVARDQTEPLDAHEPVRLVFLARPGPGGGGGGGGLHMPDPPTQVKQAGPRPISSPIIARRLPPPRPTVRRPVEPPMRPTPRPLDPPLRPIEARSVPPVTAPVAASPADEDTREGVIEAHSAVVPMSQGLGPEGGAGAGTGTGVGAGTGSGIGPGEGGGTGGGPYRPGSGVEPPQLLREVRADYTDAARRAGVTGDVVLEIVVLSDGTVGDVRILQRLDAGLDERAVEAVRRWRFAPARMRGTPVDVLVEVAVEFRLR